MFRSGMLRRVNRAILGVCTFFFVSLSAASFPAKMHSLGVDCIRFLCTPIRYCVAPYYKLSLPTEKNLNDVMLLELEARWCRRKWTDEMVQKAQRGETIAHDESFGPFHSYDNRRARLTVNLLRDAFKHDGKPFYNGQSGSNDPGLSFLELIFTDRQQQLDTHLRTVMGSYQKFHKQTNGTNESTLKLKKIS
jgi:hypothetical protein